MLHDLANDGGSVALKQTEEDETLSKKQIVDNDYKCHHISTLTEQPLSFSQ